MQAIKQLYNHLQSKVDSYEERIELLEKEVADQKEEIVKLRSTIDGMTK